MRVIGVLLLLTALLWAEGVEPSAFAISFKMPNGWTGNGAPLGDKVWAGQWRDDARGFNAQFIATRLAPGKGDAKAALRQFQVTAKTAEKAEIQQPFEQLGAVGAYLATPKDPPQVGTVRKVVIYSPACSYVFTFIALNPKDGKALDTEIRKILGTLHIL
jgi:hypothetical protein